MHVENPQKLDINSIFQSDTARSREVSPLPDWMKRDTAHVRYGGQDIDLDEGTLPRLDGIMGAVHLFRKGEAKAPVTARFEQPPQNPDANPIAGLIAWGFLGINAIGLGGGAFLRKVGSSMSIPELSAAGAYMQKATVSLDMLGATACSGALATEVAPVVAPMEFQMGDGVHPETAGLTNFPLKDLEMNLSLIDTSKAPEVKPLFTALKDSIDGSAASPIRLAVNGQTIDLTINNPDAAVATFQHVSDGKGFVFDFAMAPLGTAIVDPSGKEHVLVSFRDASGQVVVRQGIWDKGELAEGTRNAGTLRFVEWGTEAGAVNARLLMEVQTDSTKPNDTVWTLIDTDTNSQLTLASEHAIQLAATPSFSDSLVSFGSKPSYSSGGEVTQPDALPTTIALTPTAGAPNTPSEAPTGAPTEATPRNGDTKTLTENGHEYKYVYKEGLGWERQIGSIILFDGPLRNYIPFSISTLESVQGEHSFVSISDNDQTDINAPDGYLTRTFKPELEKRYFQDDPRKGTLTNTEIQTALQMEMQGMGTGEHTQAYIDIIVANGTPEGKVEKVKLSQTTGIKLMIMNEADITQLGGANVIALNVQDNGQNYAFFVDVYGVDQLGNELVRIAFKDPLSQIPESVFRKVLFSIPGNLVDHKDQREQGFSNVAQIFAQYSEKLNDDGTYDVQIELAPPTQP